MRLVDLPHNDAISVAARLDCRAEAINEPPVVRILARRNDEQRAFTHDRSEHLDHRDLAPTPGGLDAGELAGTVVQDGDVAYPWRYQPEHLRRRKQLGDKNRLQERLDLPVRLALALEDLATRHAET